MRNLFQWQHPARIEPNNFKFKSLSNWSFNTAMGCAHACRFCYVPEVSTTRGTTAKALAVHGVADPDAEWGDYVGVRQWNESAFLASLRKAEATSPDELKPDGNRAVMFCTTTDPYQVLAGEQGAIHRFIVREALSLILNHSTVNVRILTRSPLARQDFDLMKSFGNRLLFGMSLPTLNDRLARIYEPHAPAPSRRLECLQAAKAAGLNIYVAVAPTYPECDLADLRRTFDAISPLNPITVFHEPVNIRAKNVERIAAHAQAIGERVDTTVFVTPADWRRYAVTQLNQAQFVAREAGLEARLHLWPDASLGSRAALEQAAEWSPETGYEPHLRWLQRWWNRVSEWPI